MYTDKNFRTKKELKAAVDAWNAFVAAGSIVPAGQREPRAVHYYQPGPFGGNTPPEGTFCIEGPHYPEAHKFWASCTAKDGIIIKVK